MWQLADPHGPFDRNIGSTIVRFEVAGSGLITQLEIDERKCPKEWVLIVCILDIYGNIVKRLETCRFYYSNNRLVIHYQNPDNCLIYVYKTSTLNPRDVAYILPENPRILVIFPEQEIGVFTIKVLRRQVL